MYSPVLTGAIIGGIIGLVMVIVINRSKQNRFKTVRASITDPGVDYAALYHYAAASRYKKSMKFFDSYGVLYVIGKHAYYKTSASAAPEFSFHLPDCTIQREPDWRMMKWFSITNHVGEKFYFDSHKAGAFVANSEETMKGLQFLQTRQKA